MTATESSTFEIRRITYRSAAEITPSRPKWLWDGWLAKGALHLLIGRQGGGKSTWAAWMSATASSSAQFPGDVARRDPVPCAVLSLEEPADRLVARLHGASADLENVIVMGDVQDFDEDGEPFRRPWSLPGDCAILEDLITEKAIGLLTVDGLGYSIKGDSHNYAIVGAALSSLAGVAERTGCAIVGLVHPPKGGSDPVTSAIGSTAWTAIPRVCWVLGADPEDESGATRVVRVSKTNYREPDHGFAFTITSDERFDCGVVAGMSRSEVTAEDLVSATSTGEEKSERAEAREVVRAALVGGRMDTDALLKMTRAAGLSDRTVKRARSDLKVIASQRQDPTTGRVIGWELRLPDQGTTPSAFGPLGPVGTVGVNRENRCELEPEDQRAKSGKTVVHWEAPPAHDTFVDNDGCPVTDDLFMNEDTQSVA
jgi:energy-coupling factor transporter ATP-binding protein EcfA2